MKKSFILMVWLGLFFGLVTPAMAAPRLAAPFPTLIPPECRGEAKLSNCALCAIDESGTKLVPNPNFVPSKPGEPVRAQTMIVKDCCCNLTSVERMAVNVAQIILAVAGSISLLMFVLGGVMFIFSGGESGKVQKAVTILKTTVIGLAIIILAGLGVQLLVRSLTGT